jgi:transcriptional regulator with XRE-family HTH domain
LIKYIVEVMGVKGTPYDKTIIGERIKRARTMNGLKQEQLAEKVGVNPSHISDLERGQSGISLGTIISMCNTLGVSSDYLLFGKDTLRGDNLDKMLKQLDNEEKLYIEDCIHAYIHRLKANR